ncbi:tyrosine-type recombinase/integrase [Vicingus serpentipes]|uniref:Tyrosine recombinase XerC n=1 Tax=Vicingus serpentipes TaxID=1926625 RepID=A0A5C6RTE7_9FLAO|nr:tyrosine-type recombinase/integrase [Vicingus serpentipes]TXB65224.1 tyrosine-type recombinase/integrase [Vicingus serpentipes]
MQYISSFCDYLLHQKRSSPHTVVAYKKDLEQFSQFLSCQFALTNITEVNSQIIRSWIVSLLEDEISTTTINRKISTLKTFFKYLQKNEIIDNNPLLKIITPKTKKSLPVFVNEKEIYNLFENITFGNNLEEIQNKLILELLYSTGIRLSELIEIKINSIDLNNLTIKVLGKRNKERIIPISNNLKKEIENFLELRLEIDSNYNNLFLTKNNKKLYPKFVYRLVNNYLSIVTKISKKSPHVLRHTFATHMLNNGADLNTIKEILGHSSLSATQVYTHNTIEKLKNIHKQAHPKA